MDGLTYEVIGFDYEGRIVSKRVGASAPIPKETKVEVPKKETETKGEYESMGIKELQAICKEKGLPIRGTKSEVLERLKGAE